MREKWIEVLPPASQFPRQSQELEMHDGKHLSPKRETHRVER